MSQFTYYKAHICRNGHVISAYSESMASDEKFCSQCGAEVISNCENCSTSIRGDIYDSMSFSSFKAPSFCFNCGNPFPWTKQAEEAANELIEFANTLNQQEKDEWKQTIPLIIKDSPRRDVAIIKFKTYATKAGNEIGKAVRDIVVGIVSEVVKDAIMK
jgi:hypothetical protein